MRMDRLSRDSMPANADIRIPGSEHIFISNRSIFSDVIEVFQAHQDIRLLPILDEDLRPLGAIFEKDIRRILFNVFGHALLKNPGFRSDLEPHLKSCPMGEADVDVARLLDIYAHADARDGMILTRNGQYHGVVSTETLLQLAAEREGARREAMRQLSASFQVEAANLADILQSASNSLSTTASETADRAAINRDHAASVAAAAVQVRASMKSMADECGDLAGAMDQLHQSTVEAKAAAQGAVSLVAAGGVRAASLAKTTKSIEKILEFIQSLTRKINLLALNARIEAAQAGDSGKGFAVVAQEIKALGDQARTATGEIAGHIREIQTTVTDVVAGHEGIERVINSVDTIFHSVGGAVEHQRLIGRRLAEDAMEVAQAGEDICGNIENIQANTIAAAKTSSDIRDLACSLSDGSTTLQQNISSYISDMRQA